MRNAARLLLYLYLIVCTGSILSFDGVIGSLARVIGVPALLVWICSLARYKTIRAPHVFLSLCLIFLGWNFMTLLWTVDSDSTVFELWHYVLTFGALFMIWDLNREQGDAEGCMQAFVFGGYFLIASMVFNYISGNHQDAYQDRFSGGGFNPNEPGKIFSVTIPLAWYLGIMREKQKPFLRVANAVYPLFAIFAVVISGSRGGLLACVPGFIFILFNLKRVPLPARLLLAVTAAGALIVLSRMDLGTQIDRLSTIMSSSSDDQFSGRQEIWEAGWRVFSHSPFLGIGTGAFPIAVLGQTVAYQGLPAHNTFLSIATETGVIGLTIFVLLLAFVVWDVISRGGPMRWMWIACLLDAFISMMSSAWEIRPHPWILMTIILTWNHARKRDERAKPSVPQPAAYPVDQARRAAI